MATIESRLKKLEEKKRGDKGGVIRVFILDEDGGAMAVGGKVYTPEEWQEYKRQSVARGDEVYNAPNLCEDAQE